MRPEDIVTGRDYFYRSDGPRFHRVFRIIEETVPQQRDDLSLSEVRSNGSLENSFAYSRSNFLKTFIPAMDKLDPEINKLTRILVFCKGLDGFQNNLNDLLVALGV
jgi:hypothetical protein